MEDIPSYCVRSKNFSIHPSIEKILYKAFVNTNANKLPDGSFSILYAEKGNLLKEMCSPINQIIWGRRGTGKTHLLNAFVEKINDDYNISDIALYISCDRIARETPRESIVFTNDYDKVRYFANESYKNFMNTLCEQLFEQYEDILRFKKDAIKTERNFDEYLERVGHKILNLMEVCTKGVPITVQISTKKDSIKKEKKYNETGIGTEVNVSYKNIGGFIKGIFNKNKSTDIESVDEQKESFHYEHYLPAIHKALSELLDEMLINCLYICIDELWLVDEKNYTSFQPFFLDNIRQSLGTQQKLGIKFASIRETTNLNSKTDVRLSYGMQSGNDVIELAYLDPIQSKVQENYEIFKEILVKRISYYADKECENNSLLILDNNFINHINIDYIIEMLFKEERNFRLLVNMSHGIPRNFLNILNSCLRRLNYNLCSNFIHGYLISDVVIDTYKNEHRSDLSFSEDNTVYKAIDKYSRENKQYFFIIDNKTVNRLKPEINTLLYNEIIHRIPSAETPTTIMNSYKAYYLDLGMYFLTIRENNLTEYIKIIQNFQLKMPPDLDKEYKKYQLDLRSIPCDLVICTTCNSIFPKNHAVYCKYKICPDCANEIQE